MKEARYLHVEYKWSSGAGGDHCHLLTCPPPASRQTTKMNGLRVLVLLAAAACVSATSYEDCGE